MNNSGLAIRMLMQQRQSRRPISNCNRIFLTSNSCTSVTNLSTTSSLSISSPVSRNFHSTASPSFSSSYPPWWRMLLLGGGGGCMLLSSHIFFNLSSKNVSTCEEKMDNETNKSDDNKQHSSTREEIDADQYKNLPEEDEETSCTICLINRQGPCRNTWRKFEHCMKDHSKSLRSANNDDKDDNGKDDNDNNGKNNSPSLGEKCDRYMMPWITCAQSYRNTYMLLSNRFFQDEFVDAMEKGVDEKDRVCFSKKVGNNKASLPIDWKQFVQLEESEWWIKEKQEKVKDKNEGKDTVLVEGVARINLWDTDGKDRKKRVELAYVRDQDGLLLGHERFPIENDEKGGTANTIESDKDETSNTPKSDQCLSTVGHCAFHVSPETTKAIQIFALYGKKQNDAEERDTKEKNSIRKDVENADDNEKLDSRLGQETLYYSDLIPLDELKPGNIKDNVISSERRNLEIEEESMVGKRKVSKL